MAYERVPSDYFQKLDVETLSAFVDAKSGEMVEKYGHSGEGKLIKGQKERSYPGIKDNEDLAEFEKRYSELQDAKFALIDMDHEPYEETDTQTFEVMNIQALGAFIDEKFQEMKAIAANGGLKNLDKNELTDFQVRNHELSTARNIFVARTEAIKQQAKANADKDKYGFLQKPPITFEQTSFTPSLGLPGQQKKSWNICEGGENCSAEGKYLVKIKGQAGSHGEGRVLICGECFGAASANGIVQDTLNFKGTKPETLGDQFAAQKKKATLPGPAPEVKPAPRRVIQPAGKRKFGLGED